MNLSGRGLGIPRTRGEKIVHLKPRVPGSVTGLRTTIGRPRESQRLRLRHKMHLRRRHHRSKGIPVAAAATGDS